MVNWKFALFFYGLIVAVIFLVFLTFIEISYFGIDFNTIFMAILIISSLYIIIKVAIEKRPKLKK